MTTAAAAPPRIASGRGGFSFDLGRTAAEPKVETTTVKPQTLPIDTSADVLDSRDIDARIDWLSDTDDADELVERKMLEDFRDECGTSEWKDGLTLIAEHYFRDYAQELAEDLGEMHSSATWPSYCIDWDYAARELKHDYSAADLDGTTYYFIG